MTSARLPPCLLLVAPLALLACSADDSASSDAGPVERDATATEAAPGDATAADARPLSYPDATAPEVDAAGLSFALDAMSFPPCTADGGCPAGSTCGYAFGLGCATTGACVLPYEVLAAPAGPKPPPCEPLVCLCNGASARLSCEGFARAPVAYLGQCEGGAADAASE